MCVCVHVCMRVCVCVQETVNEGLPLNASAMLSTSYVSVAKGTKDLWQQSEEGIEEPRPHSPRQQQHPKRPASKRLREENVDLEKSSDL